jgi:hypothetical protein
MGGLPVYFWVMTQPNSLNIKYSFSRKLWLFVFLLLAFSKSYSAVCTAASNGNWEDPAVWSCGRVPLCTDNITIPSGFTITMTTVFDYNVGPCITQTMSITISGVLKFNTGKKLTLPSGSVIFINATGSIQSGGGGGTSNLITIGTTDVWKAADGPIFGPAILTSGGLPIELVYFTGSLSENNTIKLIWQTATENNNNYFEVERSNDGVTFEVINKTQSKSLNGNSEQILNYEIYDLSPQNGINYYRLKQVDFNAMFTYSQIQSIDFKSSKEFSFIVFPNLNDGNTFNIKFEGSNKSEVLVVVYDISGKEFFSKVLTSKESDNSIYSINPLTKLASGIYMITARSNQSFSSKRLIVK